jgi:hypothetical protein
MRIFEHSRPYNTTIINLFLQTDTQQQVIIGRRYILCHFSWLCNVRWLCRYQKRCEIQVLWSLCAAQINSSSEKFALLQWGGAATQGMDLIWHILRVLLVILIYDAPLHRIIASDYDLLGRLYHLMITIPDLITLWPLKTLHLIPISLELWGCQCRSVLLLRLLETLSVESTLSRSISCMFHSIII